MTVILNTESVNRYGYRILSAGIDLRAFKKNPVLLIQHDQWSAERLPIGKVLNLRLDGTKLLGDLEFDEKDEFAMKVKSKFEGGYLSAVSMGHKPFETSEDPSMLLKGQRRNTVIKTELLELSVVKVPGNSGAVRLAAGADLDETIPTIKLNASKPGDQLKPSSTPMKDIALKLGLAADATEAQILAAIDKLNLTLSAQADQRAEDLVSQALDAGKITEDDKPTYLSLAKGDYDNTKKVLSAMKSAKTEGGEGGEGGKVLQLQDVMKQKLSSSAHVGANESDAARFERLMTEDTAELERLEAEDKETYERLAAAYVAKS